MDHSVLLDECGCECFNLDFSTQMLSPVINEDGDVLVASLSSSCFTRTEVSCCHIDRTTMVAQTNYQNKILSEG